MNILEYLKSILQLQVFQKKWKKNLEKSVKNKAKIKLLSFKLLGCKPILIELPTGEHATQLMTSSYHRGSLKEVHNQAFEISKVFAQNNFQITRTKIEAMYSNKYSFLNIHSFY